MKKLLYIFITLLVAMNAFDARAQVSDTYTLLEPLPCIEGTDNNCAEDEPITEIEFNTYLGYMFKFGIAIAGFLAVVMIIVGGFEYMISEAPFAKTNGKERITNAIIGLLGVLTSYLILATIDPRLVQLDSSIPRIVIPTNDALKFRTKLNDDLNGLAAAARAESFALETTIQEKQKKIDVLEAKSETDAYTYDDTVLLNTLKGEVAALKAKQSKIIGSGVMDGAMRNALLFINDPATDPKVLANSIGTNKATITRALDTYGTQLKAAGDLVGYQDLLLRKTFYIDQIDEQQKVMAAVNAYDDVKNYNDPGSTREKARYAAVLNEYVQTYQKQLDELSTSPTDGMRRDPLLEEQYRVTLESRIAIIGATLAPKK